MPARWQNEASILADLEWLMKRARQQSAQGLLVPGPGGTWVTTSQDAQTRATAAQTAAANYTNDIINEQNFPQMRAEIASAGSRLSGAEGSILTLGSQMADAGSRLSGAEGSIGTLASHTGALREDVDYVAGRATTGINNAAAAQSTATGAATAAGNAATAAANAWDRAGDAYTYAVALKGRMDNFATALTALRNFVASHHPGAPSWPGGL